HAVSTDDLRKAKNLVQAGFVFGQDSVFSEALQLGLYQMLGNYRMIDQYLDGIEKVSAADVQQVATRYLTDSNRTVGVLVPTGVLTNQAAGGWGGMVHHPPPTADETGARTLAIPSAEAL